MINVTIHNYQDYLTNKFLSYWEFTSLKEDNYVPKVMLDNSLPKSITAYKGWLRFTIIPTTQHQFSMGWGGNRRFLRQGRIYISIFVSIGTGTALLNKLVARAQSCYEQYDPYDPVRYIRIENDEFVDDGEWKGRQVNVLYNFDEIK